MISLVARSLDLAWSADQSSVGHLQQQIDLVIQQVSPAVVEISRRGSLFSGVIISPDGHVFTAGHTVMPGQSYWISLTDGRRLRGQSLGACEQLRGEQVDCALIKIDNPVDLPHVPIGSSANLQTNQVCLSLSYPGGQRSRLEPLVRLGVIKSRPQPGRMIQSTALMEPGDSGGPLFDLHGRLIGIHSRISEDVAENFDVPIDQFKKYWDQLNVPEQFYVRNGKQLPKLGFYGDDSGGVQGPRIVEVISGGIADSLGLQPEDQILKVNGQAVPQLRDLQRTLSNLVEDLPKQIEISILRGDKTQLFNLPGSRLICPPAKRFAGLDPTGAADSNSSVPLVWDQSMNGFIRDLEDRLDEHCCWIYCSIHGASSRILGTQIRSSAWIVSKSSTVDDQPFILRNGKRLHLEVVRRDHENDLVLLRCPEANAAGIDLKSPENAQPSSGRLLISPDPDGAGWTSILSTGPFVSERQFSRGYLGVVLQDFAGGGVQLIRVDQGAARRAGLQVGDIIVQLNERLIRDRPEILNYLGNLNPNACITAKVRREGTEFDTEITLGSPPESSEHAADLIERSMRRDGFTSVFSHDALVGPQDCGGPVFTLDGQFVGLNIARHSRVRTFALPTEVIRSILSTP